jgi:DNA-binding transcriptional LysR family regulator
MNLRSLDLNLLLVFDAVMAERNVTRAADRIGLSQPAMSNALTRLRHHLKDELFVRSPDGMRPTARALELAAPIHEALSSLEQALDPALFDPAQSTRTFKIATNDYVAAVLMPKVMARLAEIAPGIDVRLVPLGGRMHELLDAQEVDFACTSVGEQPERFATRDIVEDSYVVLMRSGHPLGAYDRLRIEVYAAATHVLVTPRGDPRGFVDSALAARGLTRRLALTVNQFAAAPAIVAATDLVATIPKRAADLFGPPFGLIHRPCPVPAPREMSLVSLVWNRRLSRHPAFTWFAETFAHCVADSA